MVEVPISVRYKGLEKTSKRHPLRHGLELVGTIIRLVVEERPLLLLGVPGGVLTMIGVALMMYLLLVFNTTRQFAIPTAIVSLGAIMSIDMAPTSACGRKWAMAM